MHLCQEKTPIQRLTRSKAPKTQQICHYRHTRKTSELFYCLTRASTLASATILLTQVPLQKFPFLFISIIPCVAKQIELELSFLIVFESTFLICQTQCSFLFSCSFFCRFPLHANAVLVGPQYPQSDLNRQSQCQLAYTSKRWTRTGKEEKIQF